MNLRDYQNKAITTWLYHWDLELKNKKAGRSKKRPIICMATGTGKTFTFSVGTRMFAENFKAKYGRYPRGLYIAHTQELIFQMFTAVVSQFKDIPSPPESLVGIEMANYTAPQAQYIIATRQTLASSNRLDKVLSYGAFDFIVIDECHHVSPDNSYQTIIQKCQELNKDLRVVGFTATAQRSDKKALAENFDEVVFLYNIAAAIEDGYLVPAKRICMGLDNLDLSSIALNSYGDYDLVDLEEKLNSVGWVNHAFEVFQKAILGKRKKILAFFPSINMSKKFQALVSEIGVNIEHIDGDTPDPLRQDILNRFRHSDLPIITNVMVLTEGVDLPLVDCIFMARPTKSEVLYTQIVGRGLRPDPQSDKEDCLIIELSDQADLALVGSIFGTVRVCPNCQVHYFFGKKNCPNCGFDLENQEKKEKSLYPKTSPLYLVSRLSYQKALFKKAKASWYSDPHGNMSVSGGSQMSFFITPPNFRDVSENIKFMNDYFRGSTHSKELEKAFQYHSWMIDRSSKYTLYKISWTPKTEVSIIMSSEDLSYLLEIADKDASRTGGTLSNKKSAWMKRKISANQMNYLSVLGLKKEQLQGKEIFELTQGEAAQLITHLKAKRKIAEWQKSISIF